MDRTDINRNRGVPLALLWLAMLLPSIITFVYFVFLREHPSAWQQIAYVIGKTTQFSLPLLVVSLWKRPSWAPHPTVARSSSDFRRWCQFGLLSGLVISAVILTGYYLVVRTSPHAEVLTQQLQAKLQGLQLVTPLRYLMMSLFYCFVHSFLEEYYWRWFVFREWAQYVTMRTALILSSLAFTAHHVIVLGLLLGWTSWVMVASSMGVAIGGGLWAWLYWRSGSLIPSWLSHFVVDAAIMGMGYSIARSMF